MPGTLNGIGTHYYGKRNRSSRQGFCVKCKTRVALESYDTRLWVVVLFVPIVSLGRKRVLDQCPICRLHQSVDASQHALQLRVGEAEARAALHQADPTPESSLAVHASLLGMRQHDTAAKFRSEALKQFPDNADLIGGLAEQLDGLGDPDAIALHRRALEIQPDLPSARLGVARQKITEGQLDEARRLLDFLERPGTGAKSSLSTLEALARAYQTAGDHQGALDLATVLLREDLERGQHAVFRAFVRQSESALGSIDSILPEPRRGLTKLFFGGPEFTRTQRAAAWCALVVALMAGVLFVSNESIRRNRTLHLVNAFAQPAEVRIDGGPPISVSERATAVLAEGRHRVQVTGPIEAEYDIDLSSGYFERFTSSPFWAVNIGGAAALSEQVASVQPPKSFQGETFVHMPHVDYGLTTPPNLSSAKDKILVGITPMQPAAAVELMMKSHPEVAMALAESALKAARYDPRLLRLYEAAAGSDRARSDRTLTAGLTRRPVVVEWHDQYLRNAAALRGAPAVAQQYEGFVQAEPTNAALLYLRGRAEPDASKRPEYYRRSIAADFQMVWAHLALGVHHACRGEWAPATQELNLASRLEDEAVAEQARELLHQATLASGGTSGGSWTGRTGIARGTAYDYDGRRVAGNTEQAMALGRSLQSDAAPLPRQQDPVAEQNEVRKLETIQRATYVLGQLEESVRAARELDARAPNETTSELLIGAILARGKDLDEAARRLSGRTLGGDQAWMAVGLAGAMAASNDPGATAWRAKAADWLKANGGESAPAGELLASVAPPPVSQIEGVLLFPARRALLLATLAQFHPDKRDEYNAAALKWCIGYLPPNQLTRRLTGQSP